MMRDGYGYGGGHWGMWVLMGVAMVAFWGALAWIIVTVVRQRALSVVSSRATPLTPPASASDGVRILDERLARGEIDPDDYVSRRTLIERSG